MSKIPRSSALALAAILAANLLLRWRLLAVPLERDEGEYAYAGQLILRGVLPYDQIYNMKLPGVYAAYAAILGLFGESAWGIHLGLLLVNSATIAALYLLGRQIVGERAGVASAALFAVLAVGSEVQGVFANSEHFVILPAVAGLFCTLRGVDRRNLGWIAAGGALVGLGFVMKQHGAAFVALAGVFVAALSLRSRSVSNADALRRCAAFAAAAVAPYLVTCGVFWAAGLFDSFWFWTVDYALAYVSQVPIERAGEQLSRALRRVVAGAPEAWGLAALGLAAMLWDERLRGRSVFLSLLAVFSFFAVCPGFLFRPHYFVLLLPAVAILGGLALDSIARIADGRARAGAGTALLVLGLLAAMLPPLVRDRAMLFEQTPDEVSRGAYGFNPFPESPRLADVLRQITGEGDRIAILGSEPQLLFYADRRSATGHIYTYALMEDHAFALEMQEQMIREIEAADPAALVFVNIATSWLRTERSHDRLFRWFERYRRGYELFAVAELWPKGTRYFFREKADRVNPRQRLSVEIYRRRGAPGTARGAGSARTRR